MDRRRRNWVFAGVGAGFAALGAGFAWWRIAPRESTSAAVELLLAQTMPDAAGRPFDFAALRGTPLVVNFWATWCAPCVDEMPELSEMHTELAPKGVQVVGIGIDSAANIAEFSRKLPVSYPLLVAGMNGTELARQFGNPSGALPYTVLIDRHGRVAHRILGRVKIEPLTRQAAALAG
jgi:thiol-disulfide isomerase/thioredoxin